MSMVVNGSVHSTIRMSSAGRLERALRVRKAGRGHFSPRRLRVFSAIHRGPFCRAGMDRAGARASSRLDRAMWLGQIAGMVAYPEAAQRIGKLTPLADALATIEALARPVAPVE